MLISRRAARDLREIQDYLDDQSPQAGLHFEDEAQQCIMGLLSHPRAGRVVKRSSRGIGDLRVWRISPRFWQHLVYYRVYSKSVRIVRVLHGASNVEAILHLLPERR